MVVRLLLVETANHPIGCPDNVPEDPEGCLTIRRLGYSKKQHLFQDIVSQQFYNSGRPQETGPNWNTVAMVRSRTLRALSAFTFAAFASAQEPLYPSTNSTNHALVGIDAVGDRETTQLTTTTTTSVYVTSYPVTETVCWPGTTSAEHTVPPTTTDTATETTTEEEFVTITSTTTFVTTSEISVTDSVYTTSTFTTTQLITTTTQLSGSATTVPGLTQTSIVTTIQPGTTQTSLVTIIEPGTTIVSPTTVTAPPVTVTLPSETVTTASSVCAAPTNPPGFNPVFNVSSDLTWGCRPGTVCFPVRPAGCEIWADPPHQSYVCDPSRCIPSPEYEPVIWTNNDTSYYPPTEGYFNLAPPAFGLSYDIFRVDVIVSTVNPKQGYPYVTTISTGNWESQSSITEWPPSSTSSTDYAETTPVPPAYSYRSHHERSLRLSKRGPTVPSACYDRCNNAYLEAQAVGKSSGLCREGSAFRDYYDACELCIDDHLVNFQLTARDYLSPQFAQFLGYCAVTNPVRPPSSSPAEGGVTGTGEVSTTVGGTASSVTAIPITPPDEPSSAPSTRPSPTTLSESTTPSPGTTTSPEPTTSPELTTSGTTTLPASRTSSDTASAPDSTTTTTSTGGAPTGTTNGGGGGVGSVTGTGTVPASTPGSSASASEGPVSASEGPASASGTASAGGPGSGTIASISSTGTPTASSSPPGSSSSSIPPIQIPEAGAPVLKPRGAMWGSGPLLPTVISILAFLFF
ncbi:hypothetical protein DL770_002520 [Monosporascus sp. CRB-9-2]|nr:hypothetical protein DL770_002520 [Monosporascus sp. CRB-9-2]